MVGRTVCDPLLHGAVEGACEDFRFQSECELYGFLEFRESGPLVGGFGFSARGVDIFRSRVVSEHQALEVLEVVGALV